MATFKAPNFYYRIRGKDLTPEDSSALKLDTERRDQQLETYLWTPYNHCFSLILNANQNLNNGLTTIVWDAAEWDPESMWNGTGSTIVTIPQEGLWEFNVQSQIIPNAVAVTYGRIQRTDGTTGTITTYQMWGMDVIQLNANNFSGTRTIYCKAGDQIRYLINHSAAGAIVNGSNTFLPNYLQGKYISNVKYSGI